MSLTGGGGTGRSRFQSPRAPAEVVSASIAVVLPSTRLRALPWTILLVGAVLVSCLGAVVLGDGTRLGRCAFLLVSVGGAPAAWLGDRRSTVPRVVTAHA